MANIWLIAANTFREILRKKILYAALVILLLLVFAEVQMFIFMRFAKEAGETNFVDQMRTGAVTTVLNEWNVFALLIGVFLGATALGSEIKSRTIVSVLARPVERWRFLLGKWLGILLFQIPFLCFGVVSALVIASCLKVGFSPMLWPGLVEMFVRAAFYSGVSLGFSAFLPAVPAGVAALLISVLPNMFEMFEKYPNALLRFLVVATVYIAPADMPVDLIKESFDKEFLNPNYALYAQVLAENALYAVGVFMIGCAVFSRREVKLK